MPRRCFGYRALEFSCGGASLLRWSGTLGFWLYVQLEVEERISSVNCDARGAQLPFDWSRRLASASRNFDVLWVRAPILRHSAGTCRCRYAMAKWARLFFALLWVYWLSLFLCRIVGCRVVGCQIAECRIAGLSDSLLSGFFGNGFRRVWGGGD